MRQIKDRCYRVLVNRVPGIRERYEARRRVRPSRAAAWLYLLWLNVAYHVLRVRRIGEMESCPTWEQRRLYCGGSESSLSARETPEELAARLAEYDVISFDVFDTLVLRPFSEPADLFYLLGERLNYMDFRHLRVELERLARKERQRTEGDCEVTLEEIYAVLERETGLPAHPAMEEEVALEQALCRANPYLLRVVHLLHGQGKRLVATSDMYLHAGQLRKLLDRCGYPPLDGYYVSCDHRRSKHLGDLYELVRQREGTGLSYAHVGDNPRSDVEQARSHGFVPFPYANVNHTGAPYRPRDMSDITGGIYRGLVNAHLHNGCAVYSREYEYGYVYGGLFTVGYCQMIHAYAQEHGVEKILFLARDGYVLKKAYEQLYPKERSRCVYAYWSRLAATKLGAGSFRYDYMRRFLYHKVNQGHTLRAVLAAMELEELLPELCRALRLEEETVLTNGNVEQVKDWLLSVWDQVLRQYEGQLEAGRRYFASILSGASRAVAVDIGWAGSGAIVLNHLVNQVWGLDCPITGLIAGTNTCHNAEPDATETFLHSGKLVSYLYSQRENRDLWKRHDPGKLHNLYWELLLGAPEGSLKGFYPTASCGYEIRLKKEDPARAAWVEEIQRGILDFVAQYDALRPILGSMERIAGRDAYAPMTLVQAEKNRSFMKELCGMLDEMGVL